MRWELWEGADDSEGAECSFFAVTNTQAAAMANADGLRLTWTVEAVSLIEAMTKYHEHQGWEPYRPMLRNDGSPYPEDQAPYCG